MAAIGRKLTSTLSRRLLLLTFVSTVAFACNWPFWSAVVSRPYTLSIESAGNCAWILSDWVPSASLTLLAKSRSTVCSLSSIVAFSMLLGLVWMTDRTSDVAACV